MVAEAVAGKYLRSLWESIDRPAYTEIFQQLLKLIMAHTIHRVAIYSSAQRITHGLLSVGILFEIASAWLVQHADVDILAWSDWHSMVGQVLVIVFAFRLLLFFVDGSGHWRLFIPTREQRHIIVQTLKFYASLGRSECPNWFAFNPLWQPIYLFMYLLLLLVMISGLASGNYWFLAGASISEWHTIIAYTLFYLILAHIFFVVLHDSKGQGTHISAILNGYKYFEGKEAKLPPDPKSVSLDSIIKKISRG